MALLKKIKAASLVESLTASVIIVVVFMIASISFNNVFSNTGKSDTHLIDNRIKEIIYLQEHNKITFPFYEEGPYWVIFGAQRDTGKHFEIQNLRNGKEYEVQIKKN